MAPRSVQAVVTSPPYWGLRAYGDGDEIGAERTAIEYIEALRGVFSQVHRVLRDDGVCWINLGDVFNAYNANRGASQGLSKRRDANRTASTAIPRGLTDPTLKNKALMGLPWRLVDALVGDGWLLRSEVIWAKRTAMPERVRDRPARTHEHLFMLTKQPRYRYHRDAVPEAAKTVWDIPQRNDGPKHSARFPDELARRCLLLSCVPGELALDPFAGSGTVGRVGAAHGIGVVSFDLYAPTV